VRDDEDFYERIDAYHRECGGQGCGICGYSGEIAVRVRLEDIA
jgi:hypothetical protein